MNAVETALGNLRRLRKAKRLSCEAAGLLAGVRPSTVASHETGTRALTVVQLAAYAQAYGVSTGDLFDPLLIERVAS